MSEMNTQLYELAQALNFSGDTDLFSDLIEQECRRYSKRLDEEEEARLR